MLFRLFALTDPLPLEWREGLKTISSIEDEPFNIHDEIKLNLNEQTILIKTAASKILYKELRNRTITPLTAQLKFNTKFVDDVLEWKEIYSLPFRATLDTKSPEFQYKLLNRCLVTNAFLFKVGLEFNLIKFQIYKKNAQSEVSLKQSTRLLKNKPPIITLYRNL